MHPTIERPKLFTPEEWETLYHEAEGLIKTTDTVFDDSIRHQLVKHVLAGESYPRGPRVFNSLPLAVQKLPDIDYLVWSSSATVFGDITETPDHKGNDLFTLRSQCRCTKLQRSGPNGKIEGALIKDLQKDKEFLVVADKYVLCAGAVLTPGILYNSGYTPESKELPALVSEVLSDYSFLLAMYLTFVPGPLLDRANHDFLSNCARPLSCRQRRK